MKRLMGIVLLAGIMAFYLPGGTAGAEQSQANAKYASEKAAYDFCMQASNLMSTGNYAGARDAFSQAIALDPTQYSANAHTNLAECYRQLHDYNKALAETALALKFQPNYNSALFTAAMTYRDMDNFDKAIDYLQRYAQSVGDPNTVQNVQKQIRETRAWRNLKQASECIASHQETRAVALLEKAAKDDPTSISSQVHAQLAYALRHGGSPERAVAEAKKALDMNPSDKDTMYCMALACGDVGRFDDAIQWINKYTAAEIDPVRRSEALGYVKIFQLDKQKRDDPATSETDYLDQRQDSVRWAKDRLPLKVCIVPANGVYGYRKSFDGFITSALDNWCQGSKNKLEYKLISSPDDADIVVHWTNGDVVASDVPPGMRAAGVCDFKADGQENIKSADITVRTVDAFNSSRALQDGECASVCIHEVGHALGMPHSTAIKDVMAYRSSAVQSGSLTARDKASISRLYSEYPALAFVPQAPVTPAPVKFLPPPAFMPPKPSDITKLLPPMFLPPPIEKEKKLTPPLFMPPSLRSAPGGAANVKSPPVPSFLPPPVTQQKKQDKPAAPFFVPPPK